MTEPRAARGVSGMAARVAGTNAAYVIVGLEGIAVAVLGVYMLAFPDDARDHIRFIASLVLIAAGLYQLQRGFVFYHDNARRSVVPVRFMAGTVMLYGGILITLERLSTHFNSDAARIVLAATLLVAGVFGILAGLLGRRDGDLKIGNIVASVFVIVMAWFNISEVRDGSDKTQLLGIVVLLLGLALLAYAYLLHGQMLQREPLGEPPAAPAAAYAEPEPEPEPEPAPTVSTASSTGTEAPIEMGYTEPERTS